MSSRSSRFCVGAVLPLSLIFFVSAISAATRSEIGYPRVMQGPMVGSVSDHDAPIWVRLSGDERQRQENLRERQGLR